MDLANQTMAAMMNRFFTLAIVLAGLVFSGNFTAEAQKLSAKEFKTWTIHSSAFLSLREGGRSFSLDCEGNLEKRSKTGGTKEKLEPSYLQQIVKLLQELDLSQTKTKTVKGKGINDWPYWNFTIDLDGKSFLMEGLSFYDADFRVLTKKEKQIFAQLKEKLMEVGAAR